MRFSERTALDSTTDLFGNDSNDAWCLSPDCAGSEDSADGPWVL